MDSMYLTKWSIKILVHWFLILTPRHSSNYKTPLMYPSDITDLSSANPKKPNHIVFESLFSTICWSVLGAEPNKKVNGKLESHSRAEEGWAEPQGSRCISVEQVRERVETEDQESEPEHTHTQQGTW